MSTRWWTFSIWVLVAASVFYWAVTLLGLRPLPLRELPAPGPASGGAQVDLSPLLGADAPVVPQAAVQASVTDGRFRLIGVVSPSSARAAQEGLALVSVDGRPPRAYRVGATVEGQNVLQTVAARSARLGPHGGAAVVVLTLEPPAPAATGVLPVAGEGFESNRLAAKQSARSLSPVALPRAAFQSEQQLFHLRQQQQFQEEQAQNQGPAVAETVLSPKSSP